MLRRYGRSRPDALPRGGTRGATVIPCRCGSQLQLGENTQSIRIRALHISPSGRRSLTLQLTLDLCTPALREGDHVVHNFEQRDQLWAAVFHHCQESDTLTFSVALRVRAFPDPLLLPSICSEYTRFTIQAASHKGSSYRGLHASLPN